MKTICTECGYVISLESFTSVFAYCPKCGKNVRTVIQ
jgi:predicted RNA-binding Zn-ribbon protein involved in translation (DUF1610 family)